MWAVIKYNKNSLHILKNDLKNKIGEKLEFHQPALIVKKYLKNKIFKKEINLLGDYIFCFHETFSNRKKLWELRYLRGLKYFLNGFEKSQSEITGFIKKCKDNEDSDGFIKSDFFDDVLNKNLKFISGPFVDRIFKMVEITRNKKVAIIDGVKIVISNKEVFYKPI